MGLSCLRNSRVEVWTVGFESRDFRIVSSSLSLWWICLWFSWSESWDFPTVADAPREGVEAEAAEATEGKKGKAKEKDFDSPISRPGKPDVFSPSSREILATLNQELGDPLRRSCNWASRGSRR